MAKKKRVKEKRKTQRLRLPLQIDYNLIPQKKVLRERVIVSDISGGGLGLKITRPLEKGMRLKILLYLPNAKKPVTSLSEVIWCRKAFGKRFYEAGIKHLKIDPRDKERFVFLFCEMMINYFLLHKADFYSWAKLIKR